MLAASTGDIKNNLEKLQSELKQIHYPNGVDLYGCTRGDPIVFLPLLHYILIDYSKHLTQHFINKNYEFFGKTDSRFIELVYKLCRDEFGYKPAFNQTQFFSMGFAERKMIFVMHLIKLCSELYRNLLRKQIGPLVNNNSLATSASVASGYNSLKDSLYDRGRKLNGQPYVPSSQRLRSQSVITNMTEQTGYVEQENDAIFASEEELQSEYDENDDMDVKRYYIKDEDFKEDLIDEQKNFSDCENEDHRLEISMMNAYSDNRQKSSKPLIKDEGMSFAIGEGVDLDLYNASYMVHERKEAPRPMTPPRLHSIPRHALHIQESIIEEDESALQIEDEHDLELPKDVIISDLRHEQHTENIQNSTSQFIEDASFKEKVIHVGEHEMVHKLDLILENQTKILLCNEKLNERMTSIESKFSELEMKVQKCLETQSSITFRTLSRSSSDIDAANKKPNLHRTTSFSTAEDFLKRLEERMQKTSEVLRKSTISQRSVL